MATKPSSSRNLPARMGPRRIGIAIAIALLFSGLGFAMAVGTQQAPAPKVKSIDVPAAHIGDRGIYNITLSGEWRYDDRLPGVPFEFLSFRLDPPEEIRDAEGRLRPAEAIVTSGLRYDGRNMDYDHDKEAWVEAPAWLPHNETYWVVPATSALVAYGTDSAEVEVLPLTNMPALSDLQQLRDTRQTGRAYLREDRYADYAACLTGERLQGHYVENQTIEPSPCLLNALRHNRNSLPMEPVGAREINGITAFGYTVNLRDGNLTLWLADGLPVPLRYEATQENDLDMNGTEGIGTFRLDLVAFERGTVERVVEGPSTPRLPALETTTRKPWGIDDSTFGTTFHAEKAWEEARAGSKGLQDLLAKSADAYVADADLGGWNEPNERTRWWFFTVTDGFEHIQIMVREEAQLATEYSSLASMFLPQVPEPLMQVTYNVTEGTAWNSTRYYPAPSAAPKELATLDALLERRALYSNVTVTQADDVEWGFRIMCDDGDCKTASASYSIGHTHLDRRMVAEGAPPRAFGMDFSYSALAIDQDGYAYYSGQSTDMLTSGAGFVGGGANPSQHAKAPTLVAPATPSSVLVVTAAAGAAGILLGLLYWLWPALKAGPALLFSRVKDEDVLKHPVRAEIHQRIEADPGIHHQALIRAVGRGNGAVEHHLAKLLAAGLVSRVQGKGFTCYFPKGTVNYRDMAAAPLLKSPVARSIVEAVRRQPGIRSAELARALSVAPATIHYHVDRLRQANVLHGSLEGGALRLHATEQASTAATA